MARGKCHECDKDRELFALGMCKDCYSKREKKDPELLKKVRMYENTPGWWVNSLPKSWIPHDRD